MSKPLTPLTKTIREASASKPETVLRLVNQLNFHLAKKPSQFEVTINPDGTLKLFELRRTPINFVKPEDL